ncbi:MAG: hypothetical protein ACHQ16_06410 [Candidatus Lutacidiplasmatales archaeon]
MSVSVLERLPFPAALAILAAGTAVGVVVAVEAHSWLWLVAALVVVGGFAVLYLREYANLPGPERDVAPKRTAAPRPEFFASESPSPTPATTVPAAEPDSGPVEVDRFDPEYDPVAEADQLEPRPASPPPDA